MPFSWTCAWYLPRFSDTPLKPVSLPADVTSSSPSFAAAAQTSSAVAARSSSPHSASFFRHISNLCRRFVSGSCPGLSMPSSSSVGCNPGLSQSARTNCSRSCSSENSVRCCFRKAANSFCSVAALRARGPSQRSVAARCSASVRFSMRIGGMVAQLSWAAFTRAPSAHSGSSAHTICWMAIPLAGLLAASPRLRLPPRCVVTLGAPLASLEPTATFPRRQRTVSLGLGCARSTRAHSAACSLAVSSHCRWRSSACSRTLSPERRTSSVSWYLTVGRGLNGSLSHVSPSRPARRRAWRAAS